MFGINVTATVVAFAFGVLLGAVIGASIDRGGK